SSASRRSAARHRARSCSRAPRSSRWSSTSARSSRSSRSSTSRAAPPRRCRFHEKIGAVTEDTHHDVVIEGTAWHPIEAAELTRHLRRYVSEAHDLTNAATSLAETIGHQVETGHGDPIVLDDNERKVAYTVLNEWRQFWDIPDVVNTLYELL